MGQQKYEKYWSCTLAYTDIYGIPFNVCLSTILNFIDREAQTVCSDQKYVALQREIKGGSKSNYISIRKAINQFVKLGFIDNQLGSYPRDARLFLNERDKEKKKTLFSKIVYSNASLDNSVTKHSQKKEINFLLKTLQEVKELDRNDILALMVTDINAVREGFLTRAQLEEVKKHNKNIDFLSRKYNQVGHFWSVLKNLDDLNTQGNHLCFEKDAVTLGLDTRGTGLSRDGYLYRIYRNQLKEECREKLNSIRCMLQRIEFPVLVASHIKPFHLCNKQEAYDPNNGLLLSQDNDHYFDGGYISFEENGRILLSERLQTDEKNRMCSYYLDQKLLNTDRLAYLKYHRERIFK